MEGEDRRRGAEKCFQEGATVLTEYVQVRRKMTAARTNERKHTC